MSRFRELPYPRRLMLGRMPDKAIRPRSAQRNAATITGTARMSTTRPAFRFAGFAGLACRV
jgi:hypothetical protein